MRALLLVLALQVMGLVIFLILFAVVVILQHIASALRRVRPGSRSGGLRG